MIKGVLAAVLGSRESVGICERGPKQQLEPFSASLDPDGGETGLVLHHGNALHQVRLGLGMGWWGGWGERWGLNPGGEMAEPISTAGAPWEGMLGTAGKVLTSHTPSSTPG